MIYLRLEANSVIVRKHLVKLEIAAVFVSWQQNEFCRWKECYKKIKNRILVCLFAYSFLI